MSEATNEPVILTRTKGRVGIVTLNRPKQLNALSDALMAHSARPCCPFAPIPKIGARGETAAKKASPPAPTMPPMRLWTWPFITIPNPTNSRSTRQPASS